MNDQSLYQRLGGYDAISAVVDNLISRLMSDSQLGRFWENRGADGLQREKQLLVDFLSHSAGGPMYYTGRNMKITHVGMNISESDWTIFIGHVKDTLASFDLPEQETADVVGFIESTKSEIVEA
ncbi:MAG: group 1 truncated hemoglobin [Blastopirellula sp.]|nr:MAG: group 1 truncated hemoglobin [Blastopirellula sp.]